MERTFIVTVDIDEDKLQESEVGSNYGYKTALDWLQGTIRSNIDYDGIGTFISIKPITQGD